MAGKEGEHWQEWARLLSENRLLRTALTGLVGAIGNATVEYLAELVIHSEKHESSVASEALDQAYDIASDLLKRLLAEEKV